ncbi:hypothetical protein Tco_0453110, partial [Tanacetum coccineum]
MIDNEVRVTSPESTTQTLPSFEEYTPRVTYSEEVEKTLGTPIEVEPSNKIKLEQVGLNCNHNTPFSAREVCNFDGPEPQPLLNSPSLDVSLGDVICPEPPIKPHSSNSSRMKVVDYLTTQTPPLPHMVNTYPKGVYSYYNLGIDDPKRHYGFQPGLLGKSVSPGVDISNWEMFDDDWRLESMEVCPLREELSLFDRPNKVERGRILETHRLEPILQWFYASYLYRELNLWNLMSPGNFFSKDKSDFHKAWSRVRITHDASPRTCDGDGTTLMASYAQIIMVNVIPPDHVDDVLVVEPNQHDDVPVDPEPILVDEDEDPGEDEFEEEEDPQEEEDNMEVDIEEDENEPELTYPYEEVDPLNPLPPAFESEPDNEIKVEDAVESEDETVPASVHKVGESSIVPFLCEDSDSLLPSLMRRDINSLFGRMASLSRRLCSRETA